MIDFTSENISIPLGNGRRIIGEYFDFSIKWRIQKKVIGVLFTRWVTEVTKYQIISEKTSDVLESIIGKDDYEKFITPYLINK